MKNIRTMTMCVLALALLPLGGCLEIAVKTKISDDGSSERTISVKRPTKALPEHGYPVPSGPSWTSEWRETGEKDVSYEYVARKRFATPEELSSEYSREPDTSAVRLSVSIDRSFEWFYTYFDYRETYTRRNPFKIIPAGKYFTPEEINRIALGGTSDSLEKKIKEWDSRNTFEEGYARIIDAVGEGDARVNRASLEAAKEEVYRLSSEDTSHTSDELIRNIMLILEKVLRSDAISRYEGSFVRVFAEVDSMEELRKSADGWVSSVDMPGLLVSTNGETVKGSEVRWKIGQNQLLVTPVSMEARSRVTNTWAFAVTGLAALLLLLIPAVYGILKRRRGR